MKLDFLIGIMVILPRIFVSKKDRYRYISNLKRSKLPNEKNNNEKRKKLYPPYKAYYKV